MWACGCVCVCVCVREKESYRKRERDDHHEIIGGRGKRETSLMGKDK